MLLIFYFVQNKIIINPHILKKIIFNEIIINPYIFVHKYSYT